MLNWSDSKYIHLEISKSFYCKGSINIQTFELIRQILIKFLNSAQILQNNY